MDARRRRAYAKLVYLGLLFIRAVNGATSTGGFRWWRPSSWWLVRTGSRHAFELADALHNLADFLARDMEGFDEDWFWRNLAERYPDNAGPFRRTFEQALEET